jgi:septation ring formation regulator EzrA
MRSLMTSSNPQDNATEQKLESLRLHIETVDARIENMDQRFSRRMDRIAENLEAATEQIGKMSEGLTRLENIVATGFDRLEAASNTRDQQIDRLLGIVERLLPSE